MADGNDSLDIFEDDAYDDPEKLLNDFLSEGSMTPDKETKSKNTGPEVLDFDPEYINDLAAKAELELDNKIKERQIITPPSKIAPSAVLQGASVNINVVPGGVLNRAIANPTDNDQLLAVIRDNKPTNTILRTVMEEIAEEAAYIKAWRNENWDTGEDISDATFKRIRMLKSLVETIVEQEKLNKECVTGKIDFHGEPFKRVLKYFLETIQATFRKVHIPEQFEDIFFTEMAKAFDNFEKKAEKLYYGRE